MIEMVISLVEKLSNREIAIAVWIMVGVFWIISRHKIRESFFRVLKAFFAWKLVISYVLMFSYITLIILSLCALKIWRSTQFNNTVLWVACVAFVMLFEYSKANEEDFFQNAIKDNLRILIVVEFIINFYVFSLWIELLLVPFFFMMGGMVAIAETDAKYLRVRRFLDYVMAIIGLFFTGHALYMIASDFNRFATLENLESFLIPILLTIMFLPFIYFVALYASYEILFVRLGFFVKDKSLLIHVKKKTLLAFGPNLWALKKWAKHINKLEFMDEKGVDEAIQIFKSATPTGF